MGRYFVVLQGTRSGVMYVVAEVVREPTDDGRDRDLSLAANLAGSRAIIVTEAELRNLPGGRVALAHWRAGNDTSFVLDTLAHDFDFGQIQGRVGPAEAMTLEEANLVAARGRQRSRETMKDAEVVREQNRTIRGALQETIDKVQQQRSQTAALLEAIGSKMRKPDRQGKRRHLRSVS